MSITQNDITPLLLAKQIWGGSVVERNRISLTGKICNGNEWRISQNFALKFIEDIKPFMIIPYKINQINAALEKMNKGNNITYKCNFCDSIYSNSAGRRRHEKRNILKTEYFINVTLNYVKELLKVKISFPYFSIAYYSQYLF